MKARNARIFLDDIIESIRKIEQYTAGLDLSTFKARPMVTDAVLRNLEVIGEASGITRNPLGRRIRKYPGGEWLGCVTS